MLVLFRAKQSEGIMPYITTSYLGEVVERKDGVLSLKNTCVLGEQLMQKQGKAGPEQFTKVVTYASSFYTNGILPLRESDSFFIREVSDDDEILEDYYSALENLRLSKINLQKASVIPVDPRGQGLRN